MALTSSWPFLNDDQWKSFTDELVPLFVGPTGWRFTIHNPRVNGTELRWVFLDEYSTPGKPLPDVRLTLDDKRFPEARVEVHCEEESKKDPRNPNPKAKPRKLFVIYTGAKADKKTGSGQSLEKIVGAAKRMHAAIIKGRLAEMNTADPDFGRF
jgi:hypothetical protein